MRTSVHLDLTKDEGAALLDLIHFDPTKHRGKERHLLVVGKLWAAVNTAAVNGKRPYKRRGKQGAGA